MLDWIATFLTLISFALISYKNRYGFILQIIAAFFWISFGLTIHSYAIIFINLFMIAIAIKGWLNWQPSTRQILSHNKEGKASKEEIQRAVKKVLYGGNNDGSEW